MTAVLPFSQNALTVLERRYLLRDQNGDLIEDPDDMFWRVARHVARAEEHYDPFYEEDWATVFHDMMAHQEFLPNSPALRNAGTKMKGTLSACFVVPIEDNIESIMKAVSDSAFIQRFGGGIGFSISRLRPKNDRVRGTHGAACGPIAVLTLLDAVSDCITQGAAFRRGANMGILRIDHPDIFEFIHCKDKGDVLLNFNVSVAVTDEFMECLAGNSPYKEQFYGINGKKLTDKERYVVAAYAFPLRWRDEIREWVDARDIWNEIASSAWATGDPGLWFIDRANAANPVPHLFSIESTNPCGEQALEPYGSCNLGSINVAKFTAGNTFDWERLEDCVANAVRFLDDVITQNELPLPEIAAANTLVRRIGLGVMGVADALVDMKIAYGSDYAIHVCEELMAFIKKVAYEESVWLAHLRGTYPGWEGSKHQQDGMQLRNMMLLTVAPTGSISLIADCSSGIEPIFDLAWTRTMITGDGPVTLTERHPVYQEYLDKGGDPENLPPYLVTAKTVPVEQHIKMQAAFQKHVDNSISKTVILPNKAKVTDVLAAYKLAWDYGCRGITIYRDGSRAVQILNSVTEEAVTVDVEEEKWCPSCLEQNTRVLMVQEENCSKCYACGLAYCG